MEITSYPAGCLPETLLKPRSDPLAFALHLFQGGEVVHGGVARQPLDLFMDGIQDPVCLRIIIVVQFRAR